jgi:RNA polymerase sigma-70 factor (ECF subfamily)
LFLKKEIHLRSDEELMQDIGKGDKKAFEELYARYSKRLLSFLYKMLNKDRDKAEDFLQDIFMKIIERPEQFDTTRKFSTWIYTIATNLCRNEFRNTINRSKLLDESGMKDDYLEDAPHPANLDHKRFKAELQGVYEELNEKDRSIFVLRFQHELPIKDIAEILGCPEGTVKSGTYYLLKKIAQRLPHFKPE